MNEIELPSSWSEVTVEQFAALQNVLKHEDLQQYEKNVAIISIMSGWSESDARKVSLKSYTKIMKSLAFLSSEVEGKLQKYMMVNGTKYRIESDVEQLTGGQYITLMHLMNDQEKVMENMAEILALFCIPSTKKWFGWKDGIYDSDKHMAVAAEMKDAKMDVVYPLSAFFFESYKSFASSMQVYSAMMAKRKLKEAKNQLKRIKPDLDGSTWSTISRTMTKVNGTISSVFQSENYLMSLLSIAKNRRMIDNKIFNSKQD
tara:strand:+ start:929 stop:1705 length:777 start_codon:yes stop_codon:yes gene_type:complete